MNEIKKIYRLLIRPFSKLFFYTFRKKTLNRSRNDQPLKMGISAVVAMKNEEYTLPFCLESLIGFADQVIVIDNGSEDKSLELAKEFKKKHGNSMEVTIIEMPGALLGDCREAGLNATKFQWHLRWDADMIAHTDGDFDMKKLKEKALSDNTPRTIQLPRINLTGDLLHVVKQKDWDVGEPILIWFNKDISYQEYGKFDTVRVPKYYLQIKENTNYYFHCQGLKSDINLIHRFHYFRWRELYNRYPPNALPDELKSYDEFVEKRNLFLFGTNNQNSVKYRYNRQLVHTFEKINIDKYGYYPKVLRAEISEEKQRFKIEYMDGKPFLRVDKEDEEMINFKPSSEDLEWDIENFFKLLNQEK